MSGGVYGGGELYDWIKWSFVNDENVWTDEVGALVFDVGHYSIRAGYAGEDSPKAEIPTMAGVVKELAENGAMDVDIQPQQQAQYQKKYYIDTTSIHVPRKDMEMTTFLKDGMSMFWLSHSNYWLLF